MAWPKEVVQLGAAMTLPDQKPWLKQQIRSAYKVWISTRDLGPEEQSLGGTITAGCVYWLPHNGASNMLFDASHWVDPPMGCLPLCGGRGDDEYYVECGLVEYPRELMSIGRLVFDVK